MHRLLMLVMFECFCFVKKIVSYKCVPKAYANSLSCVASIKSVHLSNSKAKLENTNTISTYSQTCYGQIRNCQSLSFITVHGQL